MTKLRIQLTATLEYEANPTAYPDGSSPEQMLAIDLSNADDDTFMFLDNDDIHWEIKGEVMCE